MLLSNLGLLDKDAKACISIRDGKIASVTSEKGVGSTQGFEICFSDAFAFPGLINSHDHLDFNCFAPLGQKVFNNYTEWGNYIHDRHKDDIDAVLQIPQSLRTAWGIYKNLLAGVTTVVNHGKVLKTTHQLITVYQESQNLHSVKFQKNWRRKLNNPFYRKKECVIHTGEGTDKQSADEIDQLLKWNLLNRKLIGIHAVAMNSKQARKFAALVWCPESNCLLLNKHAGIIKLKESTNIVFGTDSALTGSWNIWHHLRLARSLQFVGDRELFGMVTCEPAKLWAMNTGEIHAGQDADIVVADTGSVSVGWNDLYAVNPDAILMVLHKGKIRLFDQVLLQQVTGGSVNLDLFSQVTINGRTKFVEGNLPALLNAIKRYHPNMCFPVGVGESANSFKNA